MGGVFDCLTEVAADGSLTGELAESWEASPDAKVWTFNLRQGVEFHNGKSFGADDVIESLQMHVAEGAKSPAKPIISPITEMKKLTDHQVQFTLSVRQRRLPVSAVGLSHPDLPGRRRRRGDPERHRHRLVQERELRSGRPRAAGAQRELLQGDLVRRGRGDLDHRSGGADQRADDRRGRRDQPDRRQVGSSARAEPGRRGVWRLPATSTSPSRCTPMPRRSTTTRCAWRSSISSTARSWWPRSFSATARSATTIRSARPTSTTPLIWSSASTIRKRRSSI